MPSALAIFTCRPNSHPFQERHVYLDEPVKIGRSVARCRPAQNNATFDCKVLSRNHALVWFDHKTGKFYLQDTKSSNGTFINSQRLSRGSEESPPCEIMSGDIIQFGVDVTENTRKVTHGCIVSTIKLFLPDGMEARLRSDVIHAPLPSPVDKVAANTPSMYSQELFQLSQYLQEALHREQMLEQKLATLQRLLAVTQEASDTSWQALIDEDRLLSRLEVMGNQLQACSKNQTEDSIRKELIALQEDKHNYETTAKESLRRVLQEKIEVVRKLSEVERSLSNTEDECTHLKEMNERTQEELRELANKYNGAVNEIKDLSDKLKVAEGRQEEIQQKGLAEKKELQHKIDEMEEREQELQAKIEALQADNDFTNERLTALQDKIIDEGHLTKVEETKLLKENQARVKESNDLSDTLSPSKEKSSDDTTDAQMDDQDLNEPIAKVALLKALLEEERKAYRVQVEESNKQINALQAQLRRLQEEIENLRKEKENEISTTRNELVSAQNEILSLQKVAEKAASERDTDISTLQTELQTVRAELERWRKDASDYEKEIVNLQASFKLKCQQCEEQQKEEASRLKDELEKLKAEWIALEAECVKLRKENTSLTSELQRQEKELSSSQKQSLALTSDISVLEMSRKELENQMGSLREKHQRDAASLKTQLSEAESQAKDFQKEYERTQTVLSELKAKFEVAEQQNQSLTEELKQCKENLKLLQEKGNNPSILQPVPAVFIGLILAFLYWCYGPLW
ncbi:sarcolemmal membrane-associated protein isoform X29 [Corvus cornix cornix]|uniref:sarcolemmal membrane-associated protein isoform X29 n=1 Tax=Corvus cornix cornix TaxID=932674 RepID=UPI00194F9050|nr:sarcolemmal membrane-associated protein isoform X29 [Corvus cornix cornix]XP_048171405.1 sarcolemmal membrane-associated protein isoform X29 [Corvus hawaiiensis]